MLSDKQRADLEVQRRIAKLAGAESRVEIPCGVFLALLSAHDDAARLRKLLDEVARNSTHPVRYGPGCWWCVAEDGEPHEPGCKYADALRPAGQGDE